MKKNGLRRHIAGMHPTPSSGYEDRDPYATYLPPAVETVEDVDTQYLRAVVFVTEETRKGTARSGQEYENPLLVLKGQEYAAITFEELHTRLCDALRGEKPRVIGQYLEPGGGINTFFEDGTMKKDDTNE